MSWFRNQQTQVLSVGWQSPGSECPLSGKVIEYVRRQKPHHAILGLDLHANHIGSDEFIWRISSMVLANSARAARTRLSWQIRVPADAGRGYNASTSREPKTCCESRRRFNEGRCCWSRATAYGAGPTIRSHGREQPLRARPELQYASDRPESRRFAGRVCPATARGSRFRRYDAVIGRANADNDDSR